MVFGFGSSALTAFLSLLAISEVTAVPTIPRRFTNDTTTATSSAAAALNTTAVVAAANTTALNPAILDCFIMLPDNILSAEGLATPIQLMAPCSQTVGTQQAFAEAAIVDATGQISVYHPLIIDAGTKPAAAPVVPTLPAGASIALFFGFNGATLQLLDTNGLDTNQSPTLAGIKCVNGLPGTAGDVFGQVSWCNTDAFFSVANAAIASGKTQVTPIGTDSNGKQCPSSRSFLIVDQDQSDNLPTKYLLTTAGTVAQDTAANRALFPTATELDNASDEALIGDIVDPLIGCTPFKVPSLDDPGAMVGSLATQELQAGIFQQAPVAIVPLNDPDCLLTADGVTQSSGKTNAYRIGVNQPVLGNGPNTDAGSGTTYCANLIAGQPPFLFEHQAVFTNAATPAPTIGNNLFTFLANRFLQSLVNLKCPQTQNAVICTLDGNGVATACTVSLNGTTVGTGGTGAATFSGKPTLTKTATMGGGHHTGRPVTSYTGGAASSLPAAPSVSQAPPGGGIVPNPVGPATTTAAAATTAASSQMTAPVVLSTSAGGFTAPPFTAPVAAQNTAAVTMFSTVTVTAGAATCTTNQYNTFAGYEWRRL